MNSALPLSAYSSPQFFLQERQKVFNSHWQLAGHVSELPAPGHYMTLNIAGEPIVIIRGSDQKIRGFMNICLHRGYPIFDKPYGVALAPVRCAYHGWQYGLKGEILDPRPEKLRCDSLKPVQVQIFSGFIFFSIRETTQTVESIFEDWCTDFSEHKLEELETCKKTKPFSAIVPVNWKVFMENTLEGYHVKSVHPGLYELIGNRYKIELREKISRTTAPLKKISPNSWTEKMYHALFFPKNSLPETQSPIWTYYFIFPNVQITIYPEQVAYLQSIPINENSTQVRCRFFMKPNSTRINDSARYLNNRISRRVYREDLKILNNMQKLRPLDFDGLHVSEVDEEVIQHFHTCLIKETGSERIHKSSDEI